MDYSALTAFPNHDRFSWADYFWSLDSDVLLTDPEVLRFMLQQNHTVSAPLLPSIGNKCINAIISIIIGL